MSNRLWAEWRCHACGKTIGERLPQNGLRIEHAEKVVVAYTGVLEVTCTQRTGRAHGRRAPICGARNLLIVGPDQAQVPAAPPSPAVALPIAV